LSRLQETIRSQREVIRELSRVGARGATAELGEEDAPRDLGTVEELPEYIGPEWGDIDWGDFDYDDALDDVGEEDEDSYGEDQ
jgi:hypothetical protein